MEIGNVQQVDIDDEMRSAYLDYAMSVIVSRALPDARDGLKPVHRRILFAMYDMGLRPDTPYRKSARIVGEVLGKYHPHGDAAVYESMVRLAQDFSMRYPLVDGQGNFGSIDGDAAAAMRYTEAKMHPLSHSLLSDIEKETVDFVDNFDGSLTEPVVLPASLPNLLVNGSSGIAVGMSTSIPPHNICEVCDAISFMLDRWEALDEIGVSDLMQFIKGPDFPTGGIIFRNYDDPEVDSIAHSYATGRGKVIVQAKVHLEELSRSRSRIIITELPYQVNKTSLLERIASLVREEKIDGITDLRDESDRQGLRIVIDLTRTVNEYDVLELLYKYTPMRSTFSIIMLALVDGEPRLLNLKQALKVFIQHRLKIVERRSVYDLAKARQRAHILEGYIVALDHLDQVIDIIRRSRTVETARANLQKHFGFSDEQVEAILNMPLRRLAALERKKIDDEYKEKIELIKYLDQLLQEPAMVREVIKQELLELATVHGDARRSLIVGGTASQAMTTSEILPDEKVWIAITRGGLISCLITDQQPKVTTAVKDPPVVLLQANSRDTLYLFSENGFGAAIPVHQVPQTSDFEKGVNIADISPFTSEVLVATAVVKPYESTGGYLFLGSTDGTVKKVETDELPGVSASTFPVMTVTSDKLRWAEWTTGDREIILISSDGKGIRFSEEEVRPMGLKAAGVKGMKLADDSAEIIGMHLSENGKNIWVITNTGMAKASALDEYPLQGRYGQGVIAYKLTGRDVRLTASAIGVGDTNIVVITNKRKAKYMRMSLAPTSGRNTSGESVIALGADEYVERITSFQSSKK